LLFERPQFNPIFPESSVKMPISDAAVIPAHQVAAQTQASITATNENAATRRIDRSIKFQVSTPRRKIIA
jgi:hypothetical protein